MRYLRKPRAAAALDLRLRCPTDGPDRRDRPTRSAGERAACNCCVFWSVNLKPDRSPPSIAPPRLYAIQRTMLPREDPSTTSLVAATGLTTAAVS